MNPDTRSYTGAPVPFTARVRAWLTPTGSPSFDGLRLAAINLALLLAALILLGLMAVINLAAGWISPFSLILPRLIVVLILGAVVLGVAWRYSLLHRDTAIARTIDPSPGLFAIIGAAPFAFMALILLGGGLLGLGAAVITLSGSRFTDAVGRIGYGALFTALVAGIVLIARIIVEER